LSTEKIQKDKRWSTKC